MKKLFTNLVLLLFSFLTATTQEHNPWTFAPESSLQDKTQKRQIMPKRYVSAKLNVSRMKDILSQAPVWQKESAMMGAGGVVISLPMPDGSFQEFEFVEASVMHPDLAAQYPYIKSYAGFGLDDPSAYLRFDFTYQGFHAIVLTAWTSTVYIDPAGPEDTTDYIVYYKEDFPYTEQINCHAVKIGGNAKGPVNPVEKAGDCKLRTYTLALSCTGEYAQFHGGTVSQVLSAMNTTLTRVNGIYEREASIHLEMHPNTDTLIFLNGSTDPFTNNDGYAMLSQNQTLVDARIGVLNYDLGHVFSTGGGGYAYVGCVGYDYYKAGGVTGLSSPVGDAFDIDYVAHEIGHQFGANHTQNNNCEVNTTTSMEPGSGSTIMSYAGVCAPNVQSHSDDYFHAISLQEIAGYSTTSYGNSSATLQTVNTAPTASGGLDYTIPKSTPFVLTGSGTDANGDVITYNWEQIDAQQATMPPLSTNTVGPLFRSLKPVTSPSRYFPKLQDVVNNTTSNWEVLPSVARTLNFRLTVRDGKTGGGCTKEDDVKVTVSSAGPFVVTAPNTAMSWPALSKQTITWNVASTNATPVSCANVAILLSTDGGYTYPITILASTANDGIELVTIPDNQTTQARIMVKSVGNIFYDISNVNFTISEPLPDYTLSASPNPVTICPTTTVPVIISVGKVSTFSGNVTLSASALPSGITGGLSATTVAAPGSSTLNLTASSSAKAGSYSVTITGNGSTGTKTVVVPVTITALPTQVVLSAPAASATGVSLKPTLSWTAVTGATQYEVQLSSNSTFTSLIVNTAGVLTNSFAVTTELAQTTVYYWRVRALKSCGPGAWSSSRSFTTLKIFPPIKFENGTISNVTEQWQTVTLANSYTSMVVVTSVVVGSTTSPSILTRVQNASGNSFQVKIQEAGKTSGAAGPATVHYIVAEEGTYTLANNGVKFEAKKYTSTKTSRYSASTSTWVYEPITFSQTYTIPVVVGQVMTHNDPNWSVFWASKNAGIANPPAATSCSIGKHIGEDNVVTTRANEVLGYMVFESGAGTFNGKRYAAAIGSDIVKGVPDLATGYSYTLSGFASMQTAIVSPAGHDAYEGHWAVLATNTPLTTTSLKVWAMEDNVLDTERTHTTDQVSYVVFGTGSSFKSDDVPGSEKLLVEGGSEVSGLGVDFLAAYPNPTSGELTVEYNLREEGNASITVFDLVGKVVMLQEMDYDLPGLRRVNLDVSDLMPGYYFLQVSDAVGKQSLKFIRASR
jgi:hypothetical protein